MFRVFGFSVQGFKTEIFLISLNLLVSRWDVLGMASLGGIACRCLLYVERSSLKGRDQKSSALKNLL